MPEIRTALLDSPPVRAMARADPAAQLRAAPRFWRRRWAVLLLPAVVGILSAPMLFTTRSYATDWANHLWLVWQQSINVTQLGHPSYFVQSGVGAFYPWFAFNGGTLYAVAGALSALSGGHPLATYVASYVAAFIAAYVGWLWLCHQLGMRGWPAHLPAILFLTSSFYVTNVYGRGDFPEVAGTSAIPLVVAGALYLLRAERWRPLPLAAFIAAVVFLTGSHTITALWGVTFLVAIAVAVIAALRFRWAVPRHRTLSVLAVAAAGVAVNAWYLAPALVYQSRILINNDYPGISQTWYTKTSALFSLLRDGHNPAWITGDVQAQLPTLAIAWALVVGLAAWSRTAPLLRRLLLSLTVVLALVVWLILAPNFLRHLSPWWHVEFPYRLVTYASLAACSLVVVALLALRGREWRARRAAEAVLALVTAISVGLAIQESWNAPSFLLKQRSQVFVSAVDPPPTWYYGPDYADRSRPVVTPTLHSLTGGTPLAPRGSIQLPVSPYRTRYSYPILVTRPGSVTTNVVAGPYMVGVRGAMPVGRTELGDMVLRVNGPPGRRELVTFTTAHSAPLRVGVVVSILSICALVGLLAVVAVRARRPAAPT